MNRGEGNGEGYGKGCGISYVEGVKGKVVVIDGRGEENVD